LRRGFENKVLRGVCGAKGEEVTGGWRKQHNEQLRNLKLLNKGLDGQDI
jgi:hypothetical protein